MNDAQRLQSAFAIVDRFRQQERARRQRKKRTRDAFGFLATGIGAVAIWVVFVEWIL
jgi:hypothetical protein